MADLAAGAAPAAGPYPLDYVKLICEEFHELAGDRAYGDDAAIVDGLARIEASRW